MATAETDQQPPTADEVHDATEASGTTDNDPTDIANTSVADERSETAAPAPAASDENQE
jgi:hypothetical protein